MCGKLRFYWTHLRIVYENVAAWAGEFQNDRTEDYGTLIGHPLEAMSFSLTEVNPVGMLRSGLATQMRVWYADVRVSLRIVWTPF
jgi:hypothetical protein